jgi:hypothetical protein
MINIKRAGTVVRVEIEGGPLGTTFVFKYECNDDHYAELLTNHFRDTVGSRIEEVRLNEYIAGYNDHKKRKPKRDWSFRTLKTDIP